MAQKGLALSQTKAKKSQSLVKPFKIEIIDLNAGKMKDKQKGTSAKSKVIKKKVQVMLLLPKTMLAHRDMSYVGPENEQCG